MRQNFAVVFYAAILFLLTNGIYLVKNIAAHSLIPVDVVVCILILVSWWLSGQLPYAENYDLFKHFLLRFSIIVGFIVLRSIFLRQSANERHIKEMGHAFIKLADDDRYLFRFGGEEFVAILPDKSIVTASFGVACGNSRELSDLSVVAKANKQLYVCKNGGKNCVAASGVIYR